MNTAKVVSSVVAVLRFWILALVCLRHILPAMVAAASLEPFNVTAQDPKAAKSVESAHPVCLNLAGP